MATKASKQNDTFPTNWAAAATPGTCLADIIGDTYQSHYKEIVADDGTSKPGRKHWSDSSSALQDSYGIIIPADKLKDRKVRGCAGSITCAFWWYSDAR